MKNKAKKIKSLMIFGIILWMSVASNLNFSPFIDNIDRSVDTRDDINLENAYADWEPQITRMVGDNPRYVYIGDANNDGNNDIVTTNTLDNNISILLWNNITNDWNPQITRKVGTWPQDVCIEDLDDDGDNDIVTVNRASDNISILLWNGTDWEDQITKEVGEYPEKVAVGDVDDDGDNDIVTSNIGDYYCSILLWNETNADWDDEIMLSLSDSLFPNCVSIGDADNDGDNDIAVGFAGQPKAAVRLWNGTGWDPEITFDLIGPGQSKDITLKDANNNGKTDIVIAKDDDIVSIIAWNDTASDWDPEIREPVGLVPRGVFVGDVDNDGDNDIATANNAHNTTSIILWNGTDWEPHVMKNVGYDPFSVYLGDANNDGLCDIVTANVGDDTVSILLGIAPSAPVLSDILPSPDYDGIIELNWSEVAGASKYYVYRSTSKMNSVDGLTPIATLAESNYIDIITTNGIYYYVIVASNIISNGSMSNRDCVVVDIPVSGWEPQIVRPVGDNPRGIYIGDANNDGKDEILVSNMWDGVVSILEWDSVISGDWYQTFKVFGNYTTSVAVGDADNDGDNDIVTTNYNMDTFVSTVTILPWDTPSNDWDDPIVEPVGWAPWSVSIGDADNDGDNDIVTANMADNNVSVLLWNGASWDPYLSLESGTQPQCVYLGDADNDGDNDIVTANRAEDTVSILLWNTSKGYWDETIKKQIVGGGPISVSVGDVNNDYQNEIVCIDEQNDEALIFLYNGTDWEEIATLKVGDQPYDLFLGDADNDGDDDIITTNTGENNISILLWNGTWWDPQVKREVGNNPYKVFIGDTNNDGVNDIVTANSGDDTVSILLLSEVLSSGLCMNVKNQSFTEEEFNISISVHGINDIGIDDAILQVWWDGISVSSSNIKNLGSGLYQLTLDPITVAPGDAPILLNVSVSVDGYKDKGFELYLAVDPATLDKGTQGDGAGTPGIPGYDVFLLIGALCVLSGILTKKRLKKNWTR